MGRVSAFHLVKLDIDAMYEEADRLERIGICKTCEEEHVLCACGVCFKYCHDDYTCEYDDFDGYP